MMLSLFEIHNSMWGFCFDMVFGVQHLHFALLLLTNKLWWLVSYKWLIRSSLERGNTLWMFEYFGIGQILKLDNVLFCWKYPMFVLDHKWKVVGILY